LALKYAAMRLSASTSPPAGKITTIMNNDAQCQVPAFADERVDKGYHEVFMPSGSQ